MTPDRSGIDQQSGADSPSHPLLVDAPRGPEDIRPSLPPTGCAGRQVGRATHPSSRSDEATTRGSRAEPPAGTTHQHDT